MAKATVAKVGWGRGAIDCGGGGAGSMILEMRNVTWVDVARRLMYVVYSIPSAYVVSRVTECKIRTCVSIYLAFHIAGCRDLGSRV